MTAEEYLNDQHVYFEVLKEKGVLRVVHSIMKQYAKLKVSEACKKQREICAEAYWLHKLHKMTFEQVMKIIKQAPEPEGENG